LNYAAHDEQGKPFMISRNALLKTYDSVEVLGENVYFFQDEMQAYTYNYWLHASGEKDLVVVSQDHVITSLALDVIASASAGCVASSTPTIVDLETSASTFTYLIIVPCHYHRYLKGVDGVDRRALYWCMPIHRCEFSGSESEDDFREMRFHYVPVLDRKRKAHPKLLVYFDNPKTGGAQMRRVRFTSGQSFCRRSVSSMV